MGALINCHLTGILAIYFQLHGGNFFVVEIFLLLQLFKNQCAVELFVFTDNSVAELDNHHFGN